MHFLSNEETEQWIEDYVERDTAGARKRVEDAEAAIRQGQEETDTTENAGLTTREPQKLSHEMMVAIRDSLSHIPSSDDGENGEDEHDEDSEQGTLIEDDVPSWVMGTIAKTVLQHLERFREMQMKVDEVTQLGWENAADYFCERD